MDTLGQEFGQGVVGMAVCAPCLGPQLERAKASVTWQLGLQSSGGNITPMSRVDASCWLHPQLGCQPEHLCVTFPYGFSMCLSLNFLRSQQLGSKGIKWKYTTFFCLSLQKSHGLTSTVFFWPRQWQLSTQVQKGGTHLGYIVRWAGGHMCWCVRQACVLWLSLESQGSKG